MKIFVEVIIFQIRKMIIFNTIYKLFFSKKINVLIANKKNIQKIGNKIIINTSEDHKHRVVIVFEDQM